MAASMITFGLLRITLNILLVFILYSSAIRFNVYKHYYLEDSCAANNIVEYKLETMGMDSAAKIGLSRNGAYGNNRNCSVTIRPPFGYGVILHVDSFFFGNMRTCDLEYIKIIENSSATTLCHQGNGSVRSSFITKGAMTFLYRTYDVGDRIPVTESLNRGQFKFIATAYKKGVPIFKACRDDQFECPNRGCIWSGLTCDNVNNCGDHSDENPFGSSNCRIPDLITIPPLEDWTYVVPRIDFKPYPTFSTYKKPSEVTMGAAVASVLLVILGASVRFYCFYKCAMCRRREIEITRIAVIRTRRSITSPFRQLPPPYTNLVNETSSPPGGIAFPTTENDPSSDQPPTYSEAVTQTQSGNEKGQ